MTDDMDKDDKIRCANDRLDKIGAMLPDLATTIEGLFTAPPPPRIPMLAIMHLLAEDAGYPEHCASARCRRANACCAKSSQSEDPPCAVLWDAAFATRLEAAFLGVAAAWGDENRRMKRLRRMAAGSALAIRGDGKKRSAG